MKRKIISCVLAASVMMTLGACSGGETEPEETTAEQTTAEQTTAEETTGETTEETEAEPELASLETGFFTLSYDDSVWTYDEENDLSDSSSASDLTIRIPGASEDDGEVVEVEIEARSTDVSGFRDRLFNAGFDEYEYAVNGAYDRTEIGGLEFLIYEKSDSELDYYGRDEAAGVTVYIEIDGEITNDEVSALLDNVTFDLADAGNTDYPWYWEGEPINFGSHTGTVESVTVNTQQLVMDESFVTHEVFAHRVCVSGDKAYILNEGILRVYAIGADSLTFEAEYDLGSDKYTEMQSAADGRIFISGFMVPMIEWADGAVVASYDHDDMDKMAMAPSGDWGVSWFVSNECYKLTIDGNGNVTESVPVTFNEVSVISCLQVTDSRIIICGSDAETNDHTIFLYDFDGNLQMTLQAVDGSFGLGSATFVAETANGFFAFDGNLRKVCFWNADGSYIGKIEDDALFGTTYPWFCDTCEMADGSFLTIMTEERPDHSADELVAYSFSGF
ncbi:MAG: hypothetical protein J5685_00780 [Clostridiales bacterium]|nr:hypothetical protein [Clostridiales bacterium]